MSAARTAVLIEVVGRPRPMPSKAAAELLAAAAEGGAAVAVLLGPASDEPALATARALGAGSGVRIWDDALDGADALARGKAIAAWATEAGIERLLFARPPRDPRATAFGGVLEGLLAPAGVTVEVTSSELAEAPASQPSFHALDEAAGGIEVAAATAPTGAAPRLLGQVPRRAPVVGADADLFAQGVVTHLREMAADPEGAR
jgi:hypothetical protein